MSFNLGLIGLGEIAAIHIRAILNTPGLTIAGVCDIDLQRAEQFGRQLGVKAYTDYRVLVSQGLDAVVICLPHNLHYAVAMEALESSCYVIIEKPFALNLHECKNIINSANAKKLKIFVTDIACFSQGPLLTQEEYMAGNLGRFLAGHLCCVRDYFSGKRNWHLDTVQSGGGMLINVGVHRIAAFRTAVPDIKPLDVFASVEKRSKYPVEACSGILVKYSPSGSIFHQNIGYYSQAAAAMNSTELFFEKGRISWNSKEWRMVGSSGEIITKAITEDENPYIPVYSTIMNSLQGEQDDLYPSAESFAQDIAIVEAAYKSAVTGSSVNILAAASILNSEESFVTI